MQRNDVLVIETNVSSFYIRQENNSGLTSP